MTVDQLSNGRCAKVTAVGGAQDLRAHLLDMGVVPGVELCVVGRAPMGDPLEIKLRGYILSLRASEASCISVELLEESSAVPEPVKDEDFSYSLNLHEHNSHPGYGETGKYHNHEDDARALPKDSLLKFAIAGQPNSGKTSLFNLLTGSSLRVGNFPGVTIDSSSAPIRNFPWTLAIDLPGEYSLKSGSPVLTDPPQGIINIVDAGNIERNLYLTVQLMELGIPMVLALNMMDEVRSNGGNIRVNEMESLLGLPVVPISVETNEGITELVEHAVHVARYRETPAVQDFCSPEDFGGAVHRCLHGITHLIEDHAAAAGISAKFAATKLAEGDAQIADVLKLTPDERNAIEQIVGQMERERGLDRRAAIADMRFAFINRICSRTVNKPDESKQYRRSRKLDKVLTGKWTSIPIFVALMSAILYLSIDVLGSPLQNWLGDRIAALSALCNQGMIAAGVSPAVRSLVVDAVFGGVGAVLSFVPVILILFFFLSLLEDSGYMSRVAFVTDKLVRKLGLSGRSIVPLLIGLGCSVPAVLATRTLPSAHDRRRAVLLVPFMSCSAKITIYSFLSAAFFPGHGGLVLICLYLTGIFVGMLVALISKHIGKKREPTPFIMELPNYRLPKLKSVGHLLWDKTKDFLQMAFTVILLATVVIWVLQTFDIRFNMVENGNGSMLAAIGTWIAPVFKPLGIGDWRIVTSLISGFLAKESVVSTMQVLGAASLLTVPSAVSMLVFCLLYTPCVATIAAVRREFGHLHSLLMIVFQCSVAWIVAFAAYRIALLLI